MPRKDYPRIHAALRSIRTSLADLSDLNVVRSNHDPRVDVSEWLVAEVLGGVRADPCQKGWDVLAKGQRVQVKSNGKSHTNSYWGRFYVGAKQLEGTDEFAFVQWADHFLLHGIYHVSKSAMEQRSNFPRDKDGGIQLHVERNLKNFVIRLDDHAFRQFFGG